MKLTKTDFYSKKERKFFKKHPELLNKYDEILETLQINPFDTVLKTHKLKGNLSDFYACRLNYEYRIVCIILVQDDEVILVDIGTHDDVY
jgi:addiction module RelE/StbE family toxin